MTYNGKYLLIVEDIYLFVKKWGSDFLLCVKIGTFGTERLYDKKWYSLKDIFLELEPFATQRFQVFINKILRYIRTEKNNGF